MQVVLLNPPKGARRRKLSMRRRRRSRNTKWAPEFAESPASLNPRRGVSRGRGRSRRRNPYWVPRYAMNPVGALRSVVSGFSPRTLMEALPLAAGGLGNNLLTGFAARTLPIPEFLKSSPGNVLLSIVGAGLLGGGVGMVDKSVGAKVLLGGLVDALKKGADWFLVRMNIISGLGCGPACMADYLSVGDAAGARPLGNYLTVNDVNALSPVGVPGGLSTDQTVEQELAG